MRTSLDRGGGVFGSGCGVQASESRVLGSPNVTRGPNEAISGNEEGAREIRVSGFGSRVLTFDIRVPGVGFRFSGFDFRVSIFGFRFLGIGFRGSGGYACEGSVQASSTHAASATAGAACACLPKVAASTLGRSQDVYKGSRFTVEGER